LSAWNNDHVAKHVQGVSKSNSQMHMKPQVFEREEDTKACLAQKIDQLVAVARREVQSLELQPGVVRLRVGGKGELR